MKVNVKYEPIYEFRKLVFMLSEIRNGFYQKNGFIAAYNPIKTGGEIVVPKYPLIYTKSFWETFNKVYKGKNTSAYRYLETNELPKLWDEVQSETPLDPSELIIEWQKVEKQFFNIFDSFLDTAKTIKSINVYLTRYGTEATYNSENGDLIILLRNDVSIDKIAYCILSGLMKLKITTKNYSWTEYQRIIDYLMTQTQLASLFPYFSTLIDNLHTKQRSIREINTSKEIYKSLGYPAAIDLHLENDSIIYNSKEITNLTKSEKAVISALIENEGKLVTFDQLAEILWGADAENYFSPEAILKVIERIRKVLKELGINKEIIHTKRKMGYVMVR